MDRSVRVFVNEICSADMAYSVFRHNETDPWQIVKVDSSVNFETVLEAYENAKELKVLSPSEVPSKVIDLLKESVNKKEYLDSLLEKGREFIYVVDSDGDTSYNFILYKTGEYFRYYTEF